MQLVEHSQVWAARGDALVRSYPVATSVYASEGASLLPRSPRLTAEEILRALAKDGWMVDRQVGSHRMLTHASKPGRPTVAYHAGQIIPPKTLRSILKDADLTVDEFRKLL
jgi:predicted RNA binding protein YcfA (HicA-like mRNA interferase family)